MHTYPPDIAVVQQEVMIAVINLYGGSVSGNAIISDYQPCIINNCIHILLSTEAMPRLDWIVLIVLYNSYLTHSCVHAGRCKIRPIHIPRAVISKRNEGHIGCAG